MERILPENSRYRSPRVSHNLVRDIRHGEKPNQVVRLPPEQISMPLLWPRFLSCRKRSFGDAAEFSLQSPPPKVHLWANNPSVPYLQYPRPSRPRSLVYSHREL